MVRVDLVPTCVVVDRVKTEVGVVRADLVPDLCCGRQS